MGAKKRHRLRLANKRVHYAIEFFEPLFAGKPCAMGATLKQLRKAQQCLGELNDTVNGQALLAVLQGDLPTSGVRSPFLDRQREKQPLRSAIRAYRKMDTLSPLCA
jgi:CHAD domain-containing protein